MHLLTLPCLPASLSSHMLSTQEPTHVQYYKLFTYSNFVYNNLTTNVRHFTLKPKSISAQILSITC